MKHRSVTLIEINIFDKMLPLVSGYLQAYACRDTQIRNTCSFRKYTTTVQTAPERLVGELADHASDVYAFSCYLWNMGLINRVLPLYNTHATRRLARWLHNSGRATYAEFFAGFAAHLRGHTSSELSRFCEQSIADARYYEVANYPTVYHITLHAHRAETAWLLHDYAADQPWWEEPHARFLFDIDALACPYVYSNTPIIATAAAGAITVRERDQRSIVFEAPRRHASALDEVYVDDSNPDDMISIALDHHRTQYPWRESQSREENASYCSGSIMRVADILPSWQLLGG